MIKIFFLAFFMVFNVYALDSFQIDFLHLEMQGGKGQIVATKFNIGSGSDHILYSKAEEVFIGELQATKEKFHIVGENGVSLATDPIVLDALPTVIIENGHIVCNKGESCMARIEHMIFQNQGLGQIEFKCAMSECLKNFSWKIQSLKEGKSFFTSNSEDKSLIELKDVSDVIITRMGERLDTIGKVKIPILGKVDFEIRINVVNFTKQTFEFTIEKVKLAKILSVTDFTIFMVRKFFADSAITVHGDHFIVKF